MSEDEALERYKLANIFCDAAHVLAERIPHGQLNLIWPEVLINAHAIELYFKCLICLEGGGAVKQERNLDKLFDRLSPASRQEIREYFHEQTMVDPTFHPNSPEDPHFQLESVLLTAKNVVNEAHFIFDERFKEYYALYHIMNAAQERIHELRPKWGKKPAPSTI